MKKKQAQKQFALAMEAYRDSAKKAEENEIKRIISRVENSVVFQNLWKVEEHDDLMEGQSIPESQESLQEQYKSDLDRGEILHFSSKLAIGNKYRETIVEVRDMIRENETNYEQNKAVVDKLYQELWQNVQERSRISRKKMVFRSAFLEIHGIPIYENGSGVLQKVYLENERESNEDIALEIWSGHIITAMKYFLKKRADRY